MNGSDSIEALIRYGSLYSSQSVTTIHFQFNVIINLTVFKKLKGHKLLQPLDAF